jgi:hypothetical protein
MEANGSFRLVLAPDDDQGDDLKQTTRTELDISAAEWSYALASSSNPSSSSSAGLFPTPFEPEKDARELAWKRCCQAPSNVHVELMNSGEIPDPFKGTNEVDVQCRDPNRNDKHWAIWFLTKS